MAPGSLLRPIVAGRIASLRGLAPTDASEMALLTRCLLTEGAFVVHHLISRVSSHTGSETPGSLG